METTQQKQLQKTSNKGKNKLKQYSRTTPNTLTLPKTTAKHLQTPEQGTSSKFPLTITSFSALLAQAQTPNSPLNRFARPENFTSLKSSTKQQELFQTSSNLLDFLAENQSEHSETAANKKNNSEITEKESIDSENKEDKMTTYIAKIPEFNGEDIETSPQEWLDQVTKAEDANGWNAARMLRTIPYFLKGTAGEWFENLAASFNNWNTFKAAFLEQFTNNNTSITLRNRFRNIKQEPSESVRLYVPENLNSTIQHAKRYKMAIEEANCTKLKPAQQLRKKLTNSQRRLKTISPINNNSNPKDINHPKDEIKITLHHFLITSLRIAINVESLATGKEIAESYNKTNKIGQSYYQLPPPAYYPPRLQYQNNYYQPTPQPIQQQYQQPPTQHYQDFYHTALLENKATAQQQNPSYTLTTIPPARITENTNLSNIFPFKFEANKSPFLLNNAATNEQKAIITMYTEAEVEGKTIHLILDIIVTADGMKKTPVGEIDNFLFTLDRITIPVKVLVIDAPQYQALLTISYQGQHTWVPATCGTLNKCSEKAPAFEFELEKEKPFIKTFMALESTSNWNIPYSKPEPRKQCPYIPLKCKDCHKKLSSMGACILPKEEYENFTCYYCKACHRE
ncbi:hypothetical protein G9A89_019063 [Geosiphon pyriformis]|nr:hypothetical protein G9A89_019063 [Geosiphon pyriformis]